jgi:hypothetical protein
MQHVAESAGAARQQLVTQASGTPSNGRDVALLATKFWGLSIAVGDAAPQQPTQEPRNNSPSDQQEKARARSLPDTSKTAQKRGSTAAATL